MCGRYTVEDNENAGEMRKILSEMKKNYGDTVEYPKFKVGEIFPSNFAPVIIPERGDKIDAVPMKWGYHSPYKGSSNLIINARSEGIYQRRMFREAIIEGRCIIPTNGFYEWQKQTDGRKSEKYLIKNPSSPMLYLAGIFDNFVDPKTGESKAQFVIITREAQGVMSHLHNRMPVHVEKKDILKWLNGGESHVDEIFNGEIPDYLLINVSEKKKKEV
jgi:putative SOS response-associated peptidase YedK